MKAGQSEQIVSSARSSGSSLSLRLQLSKLLRNVCLLCCSPPDAGTAAILSIHNSVQNLFLFFSSSRLSPAHHCLTHLYEVLFTYLFLSVADLLFKNVNIVLWGMKPKKCVSYKICFSWGENDCKPNTECAWVFRWSSDFINLHHLLISESYWITTLVKQTLRSKCTQTFIYRVHTHTHTDAEWTWL